jgi:FkbM family methyltransferase
LNQPASPLSLRSVLAALNELGRDPAARGRMVAALREAEAVFSDRSVNVREQITGPIVDALFATGETLHKEIATGLKFSFKYTSKIARDFIMARDNPDHVWEPQTTKLLVSLARGAKAAFVAGAYFGDQALLMAQVMKPSGGQCYCFEVNATQSELLRANIKANGLDNVTAIERAVWNCSNVQLELVGEDSHASPREITGNGRGFSAVTLCDYGKEQGVDEIQVLTIDIEGGELIALEGAEGYLKQPAGKAPNLVFEVHRAYVDWSNGLENTQIAKYLQNFGYTLFAIRDYQGNVGMGGHPVELIPIDACYLEGPPHGFNVFAVKDVALVEQHKCHIVRDVSPKLLFHRDPTMHQPLY